MGGGAGGGALWGAGSSKEADSKPGQGRELNTPHPPAHLLARSFSQPRILSPHLHLHLQRLRSVLATLTMGAQPTCGPWVSPSTSSSLGTCPSRQAKTLVASCMPACLNACLAAVLHALAPDLCVLLGTALSCGAFCLHPSAACLQALPGDMWALSVCLTCPLACPPVRLPVLPHPAHQACCAPSASR